MSRVNENSVLKGRHCDINVCGVWGIVKVAKLNRKDKNWLNMQGHKKQEYGDYLSFLGQV
jgi:hypothetical protein